jgi:hypothetical protein
MWRAQDMCVPMGPLEFAVRFFGVPAWLCDRCHQRPGARWLDSLWLCERCHSAYFHNPQMEHWR